MNREKVQNKLSLILVTMIILVFFIAIVGISFALPNNMKVALKGLTGDDINTEILFYDEYCFSSNNSHKYCIKGDKNFNISNQYAVSPDKIFNENSGMTFIFSVNSNVNEENILSYKLGLSDIGEGNTLNTKSIRFNLLKNGKYIYGSKNSGVLLSDLKNDLDFKGLVFGSYDLKNKDMYVLKVWIDENYIPEYNYYSKDNKKTMKINAENFSFKIKTYVEQK